MKPMHLSWSESTKRQIAESYRRGDSFRVLANRYGCSPVTISKYLHTLGIARANGSHGALGCRRNLRVVDRSGSPQMRQFAAWMSRASDILGHSPDEHQIGEIIKQIRVSSGGRVREAAV